MGHERITRTLIVLLALAFAGDASAQTRRSVGGSPARRALVERNPESLPLPATAGAYSARLLPGSKAPRLPELTPVRGEAIKEIPAGVVTLVESWASWCPNCRERAFQVGDLERQHPGKVRELVIVSPDRFGSSEAATRELAKLASGADERGAIGWDSKGDFRAQWLTPARRSTVPTTFIVNGEGVIAWIGHAADAAEVVAKLIAGDWVIEDSARDFVQRFRGGEWRDDASQRFNQTARFGRWDEMLRALDDLDLYDPGIAGGTAAGWVQRTLDDARQQAVKLALITERAVWDQDPHLLNDLAWYLLIANDPSKEEVTAAQRMAQRASELSNHEDGLIEDTLALAQYLGGDRETAIATQERAIRLVEQGSPSNPPAIPELRDRLRIFKDNDAVANGQRKRPRATGSGPPDSPAR